jgi:hypothetical protein
LGRYLKDEQKDDDNDLATVDEDDRTQYYDDYVGKPRMWRLVTSYCLLMIVCGVPAGIDYALVFDLTHRKLKPLYEAQAGQYPSDVAGVSSGDGFLASPSGITIAVVLIKALLDGVFETIAGILTDMERHISYSGFRYHRLFKLFVFRLVNLMSLFIIRYYADVPFYPCLASRTSNQAFILVMFELTLNNFIELGLNYGLKVMAKLRQKWFPPKPLEPVKKLGSESGTQTDAQSESRTAEDQEHTIKVEHAPEIELTDDYLEVVYRHYFMFAFMGVFPLVNLFVLLCNLIELPLDKLKFVKLSGKAIRGNFQRSTLLLSLLLFITAVAGLLHFPTGAAWLLPPLGPQMCWPCDTFSQTQTAGGSCLLNFEPAGCRDAAGAPLSQGDIRNRLSHLWTPLPAPGAPGAAEAAISAASASKWLADNDHLFSSRRCGCRPCSLILACPCDEPPEQRFNSAANVTAVALLPRYNYSLAGWRALQAGGAGPSRQGWCGNPISKECWTCPESSGIDFVDPIRALSRWRTVSFCDRCLTSPCICSGGGGSLSCPLDFRQQWQIKG